MSGQAAWASLMIFISLAAVFVLLYLRGHGAEPIWNLLWLVPLTCLWLAAFEPQVLASEFRLLLVKILKKLGL